jgi:predicted nucleic acid-binding protein
MILIDTSVWIEHLSRGGKVIEDLLKTNKVLIHPFVIGEVACGNLADRAEILSLLNNLPTLPVAAESSVLYFIEQNHLMGLGIGYIDAHLLTATALEPPTQLLTLDKRLKAAADSLNLSY